MNVHENFFESVPLTSDEPARDVFRVAQIERLHLNDENVKM